MKPLIFGIWTLSCFIFIALLGFSSIGLADIDKWTRKADMPAARFGLATSVVNGKIYAIGGSPAGFEALSTVEEYDPVIDKWTRKADMPTPRRFLSTSVVNGKIYAISGSIGFDQPSKVEEYDPLIDKWTRKADMPTPRRFLSTSVVNGKIYVIGGGVFAGGAVTSSNPIGRLEVKVINPDTQDAVKEGGFLSIGELAYNFPNPFEASRGTTFRYVPMANESVELMVVRVFNLALEPIGVVGASGTNEVKWRDDGVNGGLYVYSMEVKLTNGYVKKFRRTLIVK